MLLKLFKNVYYYHVIELTSLLCICWSLLIFKWVSLQRDRITSFRKSTVRKEKPLIQHHVDTQPPISEIPLAQALLDERCMNLSEKEVMDLFEKMMVRCFMSGLF